METAEYMTLFGWTRKLAGSQYAYLLSLGFSHAETFGPFKSWYDAWESFHA